MSSKILVTYASRAGSTVGVAEAIANTLADHHLNVDLLAMQEVNDVAIYDAVVAGSAIRMDKWLPEAMQFLENYQQDLSQKPFAAFLVCMAMASGTDRARQSASNYLQPVRKRVPTISEGLFAGVLDLSKLPPVYRMGFGLLTLSGVFKEGDHRDWDAIQQWALDLLLDLKTLQSTL